ncbi:hypothetical protein D6C87_09246 [Aureobasidium pullulans]|uniref:F-box domain-containing protein n=1 Tax=Aureobasidium pullulans TaxID=5580 RepID=A0AB38LKT9_AURPU|nr:hypothetical protein D6C94_09180 [Aureobasidium pullulans]THZ36322.1 hypothetical protein D6C87_09246 [Aureobasidium pullulans]
MRENQMTHPSPGGKILVDKVRFVDFTSHSEDGLGVLARLPREIREMVYGFLGSSLHCHSLDGRCEKQTYYALRMLQDFAVMKTSKQICVEFLEAFVRKTVFVTYHEFCDCSDSHFETFLRYLNRRIRISPNIRQIGFRIDTVIHNDPEHEKFFKASFTISAVKSQSALLQNHNNPTSYLLHEQHITPIRNTYGATFTMQDSSPDPPFDSSSPALRHDSTPVAKMIKFQQEHKIDYTVNTEEGLGNLRKFPREIRDMIYGFSEPPVGLFEQGTKRHIDEALRRLSKCPLLSTSKQLCTEFLENFVRGKTFVACSENSNPIEQFEHFFIFMSKRIDLISHVRGLGLQGYSNGCIYASEITPALRLHCLELVVKDTKHLWNIHKNYNIPSSRLHLSFSYSRPFGLLDLLYELSGNDMYTSEDALLYL